jgi:D-sedoheptulose 7-phosphate isomerase
MSPLSLKLNYEASRLMLEIIGLVSYFFPHLCYSNVVSAWENYIQFHSTILNQSSVGASLDGLVLEIIELSSSSDSIIFTAGNGGSATTADHFSADLALTRKRVGVNVSSLCLNSHLALNTALANDFGYENALAEHLENFASKNGLLVVFSASGNSRNLLNLIEKASVFGLRSWALLGFDGGSISQLKSVESVIFSDELRNYGVAENLHLMATHYVVDQVNLALKKKT